MGKVSIALRGWRFDEEEVFTDDGELRSFDQLPPETRDRLVRLTAVAGSPCDACWLVHGDENIAECNVARVVYGEPLAEVVLCSDHEADFRYWFHETGGRRHAGADDFDDRFHEWFDDGGRAPEGYDAVEHVDTDPGEVPQPDPHEEVPSLEEELAAMDDEELDALGVNLDALDVDLDGDALDVDLDGGDMDVDLDGGDQDQCNWVAEQSDPDADQSDPDA